MRMETSLQMQQTMKLSPQIIQSIEILQLPIMALIEHVQQELEENPVLEEAANPIRDESQIPQENEGLKDEINVNNSDDEFGKFREVAEDWHDYFSQTSSQKMAAVEASDQKQQAIENTAAKHISLHEYLIGQLSLIDVQEHELCEHLIYNIDKNGYMESPLEEIVKSFGDRVSLEQAEKALAIVQSLEPPGIGARDLKECLLLQLDKRDAFYPLTSELISNHLGSIELKRYHQIVRETGYDLDTIKRVINLIKTLNPRPGSIFDDEIVPYVIPELKVELVDGKHEVFLLDNNLPQICINNLYSEVLKKKDPNPEIYDYIQKKMNSAKWLIEAIEQRRSTLYKVSVKIVELQKKFLDEGIYHLSVLKMQEIADAIGIHVSTVSRAISNKYIQTPQGIFELKFFFTGGFKSNNGSMESWETMRHKLADIIAKEDKKNPLSDEDIEKKLNNDGIEISRRTITKYRKIMKIPPSRQRRAY